MFLLGFLVATLGLAGLEEAFVTMIVFHQVFLGFTGFSCSDTGFGRVRRSFCDHDRVSLGFTGFFWVLLGFTGFYWLLTWFYWVFFWVELDWTVFDEVELRCDRVALSSA